MTVELLLANLLHGLVGLLWLAGIRRFAGPLSPGLHADLLILALVLPVLATAVHLLGVALPPEQLKLLRVDLWAAAVHASAPILGFVLLLVVGTAAIVLVQELLPSWRRRRRELGAARESDPRVEASLARVLQAYRALGLRLTRARTPRARVVAVERGLAALHGLRVPEVLVSRGLLARLDDEELDAVIAHELAHLHRGGNLWLVLIWMARIVQAASPPALILFRSFLEAQEAACDALAARACGRPAALAHALIKLHGKAPPLPDDANALERARAEIQRRSDLFSTRLRVRTLLDQEPSGFASPAALAAAALALGGMLWAIG